MKTLILLLLCLPSITIAQDTATIPKNSKIIIAHHVKFIDVCNAILDAGYKIEKKDNDLQTVSTTFESSDDIYLPHQISVRVKDSVATFKSELKAGSMLMDGLYRTNKKGKAHLDGGTVVFLAAYKIAKASGGTLTFKE